MSTLIVPIIVLALGTFLTRWIGVRYRAKGEEISPDLERYSNLAALTLLVSVVATSLLNEQTLNLPVAAAVLVAIVLAVDKRSLLTVVVFSAATAALVRFLLTLI